MAKKPNAMGRIEGEPKIKWYKKIKWGVLGKAVAVLGLVALGVLGTLQYQNTINMIKAQGVEEYKTNDCNKFTDNNVEWLECDV